MPDRESRNTDPGPEATIPAPSAGLIDPRPNHAGPEVVGTDPVPIAETNEAPDEDTPAWEGPDPDGTAPGLVDPRAEIRGPADP